MAPVRCPECGCFDSEYSASARAYRHGHYGSLCALLFGVTMVFAAFSWKFPEGLEFEIIFFWIVGSMYWFAVRSCLRATRMSASTIATAMWLAVGVGAAALIILVAATRANTHRRVSPSSRTHRDPPDVTALVTPTGTVAERVIWRGMWRRGHTSILGGKPCNEN